MLFDEHDINQPPSILLYEIVNPIVIRWKKKCYKRENDKYDDKCEVMK